MITQCSYCRKTLINGIWVYFFSRNLIKQNDISHGICPKCLEKAKAKIDDMFEEI